MTEQPQMFLTALDLADTRIGMLEPEQWTRQSPCSEWDALGVLRHITGTLQKVEQMAGDEGTYAPQPAEAPATADAEEAKAPWTRQAQLTRTAVAGAELGREVETPMGRIPLAQGLAMPTADLAVHAWDIAAAAGQDLDLPDELLAFVHGIISRVPAQARGSFFDAPVQAPAGASETEQLMAELGRQRP